MVDFLSAHYLTLKALHIIIVICWMVGLFYLPRLFVYHCRAMHSSDSDRLFCLMERRLLTIIMAPAAILTWISGLLLAFVPGIVAAPCLWFAIKGISVVLLTCLHLFLMKCHQDFVRGHSRYGERFFRVLNEVPTFFLILVVFLVVLKPF